MKKILEFGPIAIRPFSVEYFFNLFKSRFKSKNDLAEYRINGLPFVARSRGFIWLYKEFFVFKKHNFDSSRKNPVVVDVGANTGVGLLAVKKQYPDARIWAFEADPELAVVLKENLERHGADESITVYDSAAWVEDGVMSFAPDGHGGGTLNNGDQAQNAVSVSSIDLNKWLDNFSEQDIDLFKMDVEGAEYELLKHCSTHFSRFANAIVEFHITRGEPNYLGEIVKLFEDAGLFVKFIDPNSWPTTPLHGCSENSYQYIASFDIYFSRDP